jgi:hypothetical protein
MDGNNFTNPYIIQNNDELDYRKDLIYETINPNGLSNLFLNANPTNMFQKIKRYTKKNDTEDCMCISQRVFLSPENLKLIQKQLVISVFKKSNKKYKIPFQDPKSVITVMKYMYNFYGTDLPFNVKEQIKELNNKVVAELTPSIIIELDLYYKFLIDSTTQPTLLELPINTSSGGARNRTLPAATNW